MKVISIANQKGGVAKTTTTQAISAIFNNSGTKTLAIDLDPQSNLSFAMGANIENAPTIYNVLKGEVTIKEVIQNAPSGDILPSSILLGGADVEFTHTGREYLLREAISEIKNEYEYLIIDCPPALSILTINALVASDFIIIPALADVFSLQGMSQLNNTIQSVRKYCNLNLKILGILLTKFSQRTNLSAHIKESLNGICKQMNTIVFQTTIRNSISLQEAQLQQQHIIEYDKKANALTDYINFVEELEATYGE